MRALLIVVILQLIMSLAWSMPAEVLIIRHAEKPEQGPNLSDQGWLRAQKLPVLFHERSEFLDNGQPTALFAMKPDHVGGSLRAIQTLHYVSEDLNKTIVTNFIRDDYNSLVSDIKINSQYNKKTVLICWEHKVILDIARAFGIKNPPNWPSSQFDRVWKIKLDQNGEISSFADLPQRLLTGDSLN